MPDYRGKRATYEMSEIILAAVIMFLFKEGSRNQMNEDEEDQFRATASVSDVMNKLEPELLESCRRHIINYLLDKRTLHKFRLMGKYFTPGVVCIPLTKNPVPVKNKQKRQNDLESKCVGSQTCLFEWILFICLNGVVEK